MSGEGFEPDVVEEPEGDTDEEGQDRKYWDTSGRPENTVGPSTDE